jgi:hypothetical protein
MSSNINSFGDAYARGAPTEQCHALLKVIDAHGLSLDVLVMNAARGMDDLLKMMASDSAKRCGCVAVYVRPDSAVGRINALVYAVGVAASAAGRRFALIGVRRGGLTGEAQRLIDWCIY